jgi:hypothetical protein
MATDDFDDLHGLPRWARWVLRPCQLVVGVAGFLGFIAFIIFGVCFFLAFRSGAVAPVGERVVQLRDHADVVYVTATQHRVIEFFKVASLVGLGIGVPGYFALQALARGLRNVYARREPIPSGSGIIVAAPRRKPPAADTIEP